MKKSVARGVQYENSGRGGRLSDTISVFIGSSPMRTNLSCPSSKCKNWLSSMWHAEEPHY